jgi:hypothetical protein
MSENFSKPQAYKSLNASSTICNIDDFNNEENILDKSSIINNFVAQFANLFKISKI